LFKILAGRPQWAQTGDDRSWPEADGLLLNLERRKPTFRNGLLALLASHSGRTCTVALPQRMEIKRRGRGTLIRTASSEAGL